MGLDRWPLVRYRRFPGLRHCVALLCAHIYCFDDEENAVNNVLYHR